jgi:hypothetical protein
VGFNTGIRNHLKNTQSLLEAHVPSWREDAALFWNNELQRPRHYNVIESIRHLVGYCDNSKVDSQLRPMRRRLVLTIINDFYGLIIERLPLYYRLKQSQKWVTLAIDVLLQCLDSNYRREKLRRHVNTGKRYKRFAVGTLLKLGKVTDQAL